MTKTIAELDRQYGLGGGLYHRHLQNPKVVKKEGAFLVGTFWVAHYWIARGERDRGRELIEQGLSYANDLGLFSEEIDPRTKESLGNIPLGLIHGSFLSALADLEKILLST
jgi:GH15 family glucan-1,4-alpha-glucosidase